MRKNIGGKVFVLLSVIILLFCAGGMAEEEYPPAYPLPKLTGNMVEDFIAVARSQVGYTASETNLSEYWVWAGEKGTHAWCTEFVCWCAAKANIPETVVPLVNGTQKMRSFFSKQGRYYCMKDGCTGTECACASLSSGTITFEDLQPGDIILMETNNNYDDGSDHAAIVVKVEDGSITLLDGNVGGEYYDDGTKGYAKVYERTRKFEKTLVHGVCCPFRKIPEPDFLLPAGLTAIESEAFAGIKAKAAVIPKTVTSIAGDPFEDSGVKVIYGYYDSAAETLATTHGYSFVGIDDDWMARH